MERPLDERHVAQHFLPARGNGIALRPAAMIGHQDEGQVRPGRLVADPLRKRPEIGVANGFFREQHEGDVILQSDDEFREVAANLDVDTGLLDKSGRHRGVATVRRQDKGMQPGQRGAFGHSDYILESAGASSVMMGVPRSTPWKPRSGSPICTPSLMVYSRIVSSWEPVRFLMIEMARLTSLLASK